MVQMAPSSQTYTVLSISVIETLMANQTCWQHKQICIVAKKNCNLKGCKNVGRAAVSQGTWRWRLCLAVEEICKNIAGDMDPESLGCIARGVVHLCGWSLQYRRYIRIRHPCLRWRTGKYLYYRKTVKRPKQPPRFMSPCRCCSNSLEIRRIIMKSSRLTLFSALFMPRCLCALYTG